MAEKTLRTDDDFWGKNACNATDDNKKGNLQKDGWSQREDGLVACINAGEAGSLMGDS